MRSVLTIAGSDSSGGAGVQADIKTIEAHGLFRHKRYHGADGAEHARRFGVVDVDPSFVVAQIDAVFEDIRPMR